MVDQVLTYVTHNALADGVHKIGMPVLEKATCQVEDQNQQGKKEQLCGVMPHENFIQNGLYQ
jgi:hypothetical protein